MMKTAIFPGSFDPFTIGHQDIAARALPLFDKVVIAIGVNENKHTMLSIEKRLEIIKKCFENEQKVEVLAYSGLTVDFCKKIGAKYIIRGIRNGSDFLYEQEIAQINSRLAPEIETIFFATAPNLAFISSSAVREIYRNGGDYRPFLPQDTEL